MAELAEGSKVLVVGPQWLGDAVMAEPGLRALHQARPDLQLTLATPKALAPLFRDHPGLADVFEVEPHHRGLFGRGRLSKDLKGKGFDAALVLRNSFGAAWDVWRAGVPVRAGFQTFGRGWCLTEPVPWPTGFKKTHRSQHYRTLAASLGAADGEDAALPLPSIPVSDEARQRAEAALKGAVEGDPQDFTRPLVGIHPAAAYGPAKMWSERKFGQLADRLIEDHGATVVLLGSKDEQNVCTEVARHVLCARDQPERLRSLAGETASVEDLAGVLACCDLVVGNDSGPAHLAAAVGAATVTIYGSTSSDFTGVRGEKVANIWERLDCSPCFRRECHREDYMACMDAIPVARAYTTIAELMGYKEPEFEEIEAVPGDAPPTPERGG